MIKKSFDGIDGYVFNTPNCIGVEDATDLIVELVCNPTSASNKLYVYGSVSEKTWTLLEEADTGADYVDGYTASQRFDVTNYGSVRFHSQETEHPYTVYVVPKKS